MKQVLLPYIVAYLFTVGKQITDVKIYDYTVETYKHKIINYNSSNELKGEHLQSLNFLWTPRTTSGVWG